MIDTHAHLFLSKTPLEDLLTNAKNAGVEAIVHVATCLDTGFKTLETAKKHEMLIPTIGIHPSESGNYHQVEKLADAVQNHPFKAIGETGLDYYWPNHAPKEAQHANLRQHLDVARSYQLPIILHNRHSDEDLKTIINEYPDVVKVIHCFSSDIHFANDVINENTFFSFTGMITYAKKGKVIQAVREIPLSKIMIETDSPYLTPDPHRGQANEPAFLGEVAKKIALVKDIPVEDIIEATTQTAKAFFRV